MKPGDVIAERFELDRFVARGGMSDVWRAIDRQSGEPVAIKVLTASYPQLIDRLALEARALTRLDHPAIVRHVAHETDRDRSLYLAMEWLDGVTLDERLRSAPLSVEEALAMAARIADGLAVAHGRGMVHRDIKPLNLLLPDNRVDQVKILDFGIVRMTEQQQITATGIGMGTPEYMAPEQARCDREIGPAADVFALGCVLFRCLTGQPAFQGRRIEAILAKIAMVDSAPRIAEVEPAIPAAVDRLVADMMAPDPADRPADGAAAAARIRDVREGLTIGLEPTAQIKPRRSLTRSELEPVSVIFADLAFGDADTVPSELAGDSLQIRPADTDASTMPNPLENLRVMRGPSDAARALPLARRALEPYGARVELLYNGSLVALITGGASVVDQIARAARGALAIRTVLPEASVGVASGRAQSDDREELGPIIDAAAGLVRRSSQELWIDATTAKLLPRQFEIAEEEDGRARLLGETVDRHKVEELPRQLLGRETTCVGRNRLVRQLAAAFSGCVEDRAGEAIVITGDAGVGKSRLRAELLTRFADDHPDMLVVPAWGDPVRTQAPYSLIGRALRRALGIPDGDRAARIRQLQEAVAARVTPGDADRVVEMLGELIDVKFHEEESPRIRAVRRDPELLAAQVAAAFTDWLCAEAAAQPVLIVVDDLQWADQASVELLAGALPRAAELPVMLLCLGRPEVGDRFASLGERWNRQTIVLDALRLSDCQKLVDDALGDTLDVAARETIARRSAGNPFYLEELIRAAAEGNADRLPDSVLASVQLRIGRQPEGARQVLRAASIYGRKFWPAGVRALLDTAVDPDEVRSWLDTLERAELVQRISDSSPIGGEPEYVFRHDLTREAAYSSLTDRDRKTGHRLAGYWLEAAGERDAVVLAEHFAGGGVAEQAVTWFEKAAEQALKDGDGTDMRASLLAAGRHLLSAADTAARSYANQLAVLFYQRAIALLGSLEPATAVRARLRLSEVLQRVGELDNAMSEVAAGLSIIPEGDEALRAEVLLRRSQVSRLSDDEGVLERARSDAYEARDLAAREDRPDLEAQALTAVAAILVRSGSDSASDKAVRYAERALAMQTDQAAVAEGLFRLANAFLLANDLDRSAQLYHDALGVAERLGEAQLLGLCRANLGMVALRRWRIGEALELAQRALAAFDEIGDVGKMTEQLVNIGTMHYLGGDMRSARPYLEQALERAGADWVSATACQECLAEIARHSGEEFEAQQLLRSAGATCASVGAHDRRALFLGLLSESLWSDGLLTEALECLEEAGELAGVTLSHALLMVRLGQLDDAEQLLAQFAESLPDPDRRLLAVLGLVRIGIARGDYRSAAKSAERALELVPSEFEHYSVPVRVLAACADRDLSAALTALEAARPVTGAHLFAELAVDVGALLESDEVSKPASQRFLELTEEIAERSLAHRVALLRGLAHARLGEPEAAARAYRDARAHADALVAQLSPDSGREELERHAWVVAARSYRAL